MLEYLRQIFVVILAAGLSGLIGVEREHSHRPAGLRTHILVGMGSALLAVVSLSTFGTEASRVMQGVVTGIGFLGAGSIIASGKHVQGITTAATIWVTAILGIAVGLGHYALSVVSTVLIVIVLQIKSVEQKLH